MSFVPAFLFALVLLAAFTGYGRLLQSALRLPALPENLLESPTLGVAFLAFLGSLLNLFSLAYENTLLVLVAIGIILFAFDLFRSYKLIFKWLAALRPRIPQLLTLLLVGLLLTRLAASIVMSAPNTNTVSLNPHDDMHAYLVAPMRLLQTGNLGVDPFNDRLLIASLGTPHFLNALVFAPLPWDFIHLLDQGLGLILVSLAAAALGLRLGLSVTRVLVIAFIPLLFHFPLANISANFLPTATLIVLASHLLSSKDLRLSNLLPAALLFSTTCSLKSTMIPAAAIFYLAWLFLVARSRTSFVIRHLAFIIIGGFLITLPWMLFQFHSGGTLFYPLFGRGTHAVDPPLPAAAPELLSILYQSIAIPAALTLLGFIAIALKPSRQLLSPAARAIAPAMLLAWTASLPAFALLTRYPDFARYAVPIALPALVVMFGVLFSVTSRLPHVRFLAPAAFAALLVATFAQWQFIYATLPHNLFVSFTAPVINYYDSTQSLRELQNATPPGEPLLVYASTPALLDFARNPIYVMDWPAETAPHADSLPLDTPDHLAEYLKSNHIRYILFTHDDANFSPKVYANLLAPAAGPVYNRYAQNAFRFQSLLSQLGTMHSAQKNAFGTLITLPN